MMSDKPVTTKKLTSIFPIGFEGNNTEIATEEDSQRMKAWGEAMNKLKTTKWRFDLRSYMIGIFAQATLGTLAAHFIERYWP